MSAALDLLVRLHNDGFCLRAVADGELEYDGADHLVTDVVVADLRKHKADLLELLEWDEEAACGLIREALAYLSGRYVEGSDLSVLYLWEDRIDEAFAETDMGALRVALRGFVRAGAASFAGDRYA